MFQFWIFAALMLLAALSFMLIPLLMARGQPSGNDEGRLNVQLAQTKMRELEQEYANGQLSQPFYVQAVEELENSLHQDLKTQANKTVNANAGRWLAIPLMLLVPLLALALYSTLGDMRAFDSSVAKAAEPTPTAQTDDVNAMVESLSKRLEKEPQDAKGWLMLGRSKMVMKDYQEAVAALRKAQALLGDKADVLLQLADALAMANGGTLKGEPGELVSKALALEPDNEMGLWLHGMVMADTNNYTEALNSWTKLQKHYPPGEKPYREVQNLIDGAKAKLGQPTATKPSTEVQTAVKNSGEIKVSVKLADALKDKVKADDPVFIYAQALNGPKAPLAIVKKQVRDLPVEQVLDDSMAMMEGMNLSSFETIKLIARVSTSGNAMPQAGDIYGELEVKGADRSGIKQIVIADTIK